MNHMVESNQSKILKQTDTQIEERRPLFKVHDQAPDNPGLMIPATTFFLDTIQKETGK